MSAPARRVAAERVDGRRRGGIAAWRDAHLHSLLSSLGRTAARPWATALTVGVIAIALALPLCLLLVLDEVGRFAGTLSDSREVAVFLLPETSAEEAEALAEQLAADPRITSLQLRTPEAGLEELRGLQDLSGALDVLGQNPLPWVLLATPNGADEQAVVGDLAALPQTDFVQHDAHWRQRLGAWLELGRRFAEVVAGLLALGVLLVVGNTVRLDVQGRAEEIATLRLLGATDGFVRRPFLYLGAWYGMLGALFALAIALVVRALLQQPVGALLDAYQNDFNLAPLAPATVLLLFSAALALGWLGAYLAVGHHLRHAESSE
jgi:cell division transport system permease protein